MLTKLQLLKEKLRINEELLEVYFSTDTQYDEILEENEKLKNEISKLKSELNESSEILDEMAKSRCDIIDKCEELGKLFIKHFHKIYLNPDDINYSHWCGEMKGWFDTVRKFKFKPNSRYILDGELRDLFFTAGDEYNDFVRDATRDEEEKYDEFCTKLLNDKEHFENVINKIFNKD